jgi:hypothetical protein
MTVAVRPRLRVVLVKCLSPDLTTRAKMALCQGHSLLTEEEKSAERRLQMMHYGENVTAANFYLTK